MSDSARLFVISAPSGAGKTTVLRRVLDCVPRLRFSVSHTTRVPRPGEEDGRDYHFVDRAMFTSLAEAKGFIEMAEVHGELYGTSFAEWERAQGQGLDLLLDIDVQGATQVRQRVPDAVTIFILPPHHDDLERRLRSRGDVEEQRLVRRLAGARAEVARAREYDYITINGDLDLCVSQVEAVILAARCRTPWASPAVRAAVASFGVPWDEGGAPKERRQ